MGAGSITSNVKSDKTLVVVKDNRDSGEEIETGLKKFGAMLGDHVEVGCNSVLNPGTVICPNCNVYPLSSVRGVIPANHIYKDADHIVAKKEKIVVVSKKVRIALDFRKKICKNISGMSNDNEFIYN